MPDLDTILDAVTHAPASHAVLALIVALLIGSILTRILRAVLQRVTRRTNAKWDDRLALQLAGPVSGLIALQLFRVSLEWIELPTRSLHLVQNVIAVLTVLVVIWAVFRFIDLVVLGLEQRSWARNHPASRSVLALGSRFLKGAMFVIGLLVALSHLGVSVASLLAGLGLGGLALALAAQKTVENLFGAVSIGIDQPLREGDFVKVGEIQGTVEQIGLRSTRIRTLDRTIVTITNGDLSNQRVETMALRDRYRLAMIVGLEYGITAAQMRDVLSKLEAILRAQPKNWAPDTSVKLKAFGASSLDIEVIATFTTRDGAEFNQIRQDTLLAFMEAIDDAGAALAFPTQTLHVASVPPPDRRAPEETPRSQPRSSGSAPAS